MSAKQEALNALNHAVHTYSEGHQAAGEGTVSVAFFHVATLPGITGEQLVKLILTAREGYYGDMDADRWKKGPSYIEVGAWIGDQGQALRLFGMGQTLGLWTVITPATLGFTDAAEIQQMAGMGYVMAAPGVDSPLLAEVTA